MLNIVVILEIGDEDAFLQFETQAIRIVRRYGGELVGAFRPDPVLSTEKGAVEIHYLRFPDIDAFDRYRRDADLLALSGLREKAIGDTKIYVSASNVEYK